MHIIEITLMYICILRLYVYYDYVYTAHRSKNILFEIFNVFLTERLLGADTGKE